MTKADDRSSVNASLRAEPIVHYTIKSTVNGHGGTSSAALDVISGNGGDGIQVTDPTTSDNLIEEVYAGTDVTGNNPVGNGGDGIDLLNGTTGNSIGGTTTEEDDVIDAAVNFAPGGASNLNNPPAVPVVLSSGNAGNGITIAGVNRLTIAGAFVGTNAAGNGAVPNQGFGIRITGGASSNTIGSTAPGLGDLISGNAQGGVLISGDDSDGNLIEGNFIGTNLAGTARVRNTGDGIDILNGASNNSIGTSTSLAGNLISGNQGAGIVISGADTDDNVVQSNFIGTDVTGNTALANGMDGVDISVSASDNTIGGSFSDNNNVRNVIAGNSGNGVAISGASDNSIEGDDIGIGLSGATGLPNGGDGVLIGTGSSDTEVGGADEPGMGNLISANAGFGVEIDGGTSTNVEGNLIGTDSTGNDVFGNSLGGVAIEDGGSGNEIGGTSSGAGNVISGNGGDGVGIVGVGTSANTVENNQIGTNISGTLALPNVLGVEIFGLATGNTIGGTEAGAGNVISGNLNDGIDIHDSGTSGNAVEGNDIGTDISGTTALANGGNGVSILNSASGNTIGGTAAGAGNVISGNQAGDGVAITGGAFANAVEGNLIGSDSTGTVAIPNGIGVEVFGQATGNTIGGTQAGAGNVISGNANDGIDIHDSGTTGNAVEGNFIGLNSNDSGSLPNFGNGVNVLNAASGNTIGGTAPGAGNVIQYNGLVGVGITGANLNNIEGNTISGNATYGVMVSIGAQYNTIGGTQSGAGNVIYSNPSAGLSINGIGTSYNKVEGNSIDSNGTGVDIAANATGNTIGGTEAGARNVISANTGDGIDIDGNGTSDNAVEGNDIGTDPTGTVAEGNSGNGVTIYAEASNNTIGGDEAGAVNVISANGSSISGVTLGGVVISGTGTTGNAVEGNFIGTDLTGNVALGNVGGGIVIDDGATGNEIGDSAYAARNEISGNNGPGIDLNGSGTADNTVENNDIGTNIAGTGALANTGAGVSIGAGAAANTIGGTAAGVGNLISGNGGDGIDLDGSNTTGNLVQGNDIGTDETGTQALPNQGDGVTIEDSASQNTIGGTEAGAGNIIAFNSGNGVTVGSNDTDTSVDDSILENSIFSNSKLGIDLGDDGVTLNDSSGHTGPNLFQDFPVISAVYTSDGTTVIEGSLSGAANTTYRVEFYVNPAADPSGYGQGQTFVTFSDVTTNGSGQATFSVTTPSALTLGQFVSATATNPSGDTSEFSADQVVTPPEMAVLTGFSVSWGSQTDALNLPASSGGLILPAGRTTDLPWYGIDQITVTFNSTVTLTASDVTVTSAIGVDYGPVTVTGSGSTYTITLAQPIDQADLVTITIGSASIETFSGVLAVLPGDVGDYGVVNAADVLQEEDQWAGITTATIFGDVTGDGSVTESDYLAVRQRTATTLPPAGS